VNLFKGILILLSVAGLFVIKNETPYLPVVIPCLIVLLLFAYNGFKKISKEMM